MVANTVIPGYAKSLISQEDIIESQGEDEPTDNIVENYSNLILNRSVDTSFHVKNTFGDILCIAIVSIQEICKYTFLFYWLQSNCY